MSSVKIVEPKTDKIDIMDVETSKSCLKTTTTATLAILAKNGSGSQKLCCDSGNCSCHQQRNFQTNNCSRCFGSENNNNNNCLKKPFIADLALLDTDYLLKSSPMLSVPDLLKTPTISPIKSASSSGQLHIDDLNTPSMCSSTPKNHGQAFFGEHEPLLTANIEISTIVSQQQNAQWNSNQLGLHYHCGANNSSSATNSTINEGHTTDACCSSEDESTASHHHHVHHHGPNIPSSLHNTGQGNHLKDQKTTFTIKGSISTNLPFNAQNINSPGLSASIFQFSPIVEHFLQNHFLRNQTLPVLTVDAKTPNPNDTPDLMKVLFLLFVLLIKIKVVRMQDEKKDIIDLSSSTCSSNSCPNNSSASEQHSHGRSNSYDNVNF